ncbi:MAG TPA: response regulator [Bryobacteraceae bacterium]|nr:response regulator [Bryobacteraceae bacterium]
MAREVTELPLRARPASVPARDKVLVVDDDEHFRVLARSLLEPAGFEVLEAGSMDQCLSELHRHPIGAVVLDMVMPDYDGIEAVRELKSRFPRLRIVAISGADQREVYLSVSAHLGADASLEKARISALCPLLHVVLER